MPQTATEASRRSSTIVTLRTSFAWSVPCGRTTTRFQSIPTPTRRAIRFWNPSGLVPSYGLHDAEREPDAYAIFSWVHTFDPTTLLTLSPFYHYNAANYQGGPDDYPVITNVNLQANYVGFQGIAQQELLEERPRRRSVRFLPAPVQLFRQRIHRRHAEFSAVFNRRKRRSGRRVHQRPVQCDEMVDRYRRPARSQNSGRQSPRTRLIRGWVLR